MTKETKQDIQLYTAVGMCIVGVAMLTAGIIIPPVGQIHNSILIAVGEVLTFSGSLFGVDYHYRYKERNG